MKHSNVHISSVQFQDLTTQITAPGDKLTISPVTTEIYTLTLSDLAKKYKIIEHTNPAILYVPSDADVDCPVGSSIIVSNYGTTYLNIAAGSGATLNTPQSFVIDSQFGRVVIIKTEPNTWELDGTIQGARQVFIFQVIPRFLTKVLDEINFDPPLSTNAVKHITRIVDSGSGIYTASTAPDFTGDYIWNGPSILDDSRTFTNSDVYGLYLKATIETPGITFDTTQEGLNIYRAENEWALCEQPISANGYLAYSTNPQWKVLTTFANDIQYTLKIEVSNSASDLEIIGFFNVVVEPLLYDNFIESQTASISENFFYIDEFGELFKRNGTSGTGTSFGSVTLHPEYQNEIDPWSFEGIYFRVSGLGTHTGTGTLGTIYPFDPYNVKNITFGKPANLGLNDTWNLEVLTDSTGSLVPYCSFDITFLP